MSRATRYDVGRLLDDIALRGWQPADLADRAGVARSTVSRFLSGDFQTARTAKKLADALGYSVRRYLVTAGKAVA
ncbi:MAG TPA: helix-turn-helix transcriptional regulator [Vicinamibacterales bacterium]|nr:helix-turn-helix transcriptional regulator [Vicinamibacterales bacterium]